MMTILFMPTMRCNLKCPYCHFKVYKDNDHYGFNAYNRSHKIEKELSWQEWIKGFEPFKPYHLEITGGEPLVYDGIKALMAAIPDKCTWAITSNTLNDVSEMDLTKCIFWTASFHDVQIDTFQNNLKTLKDKIKPSKLAVSIMAEFNNLDKSIKNARYFKQLKYKVNVLREMNPGINWENTGEWEKLVGLRKEKFNVVEKDIPPKYEFERGFICKAGSIYFCAMPDGRVYRCYSEAMLSEPIGNIDDFKPFKKEKECHTPCLACAQDYKFRCGKIK